MSLTMILGKRLYWKYLNYRRDRKKKTWQQKNNPDRRSIPVFLTGCARSGTTMTARALAKSWEVEFYSDGDASAFNHWYLRDFFTIHKLLEHSYARILLFHTNNELVHTPYFLSRHSGAKAILVFRHYMDVVNSTLRNKWEWVKGQAVFDLKLLRTTVGPEEYKSFFKLLGDTVDTQLSLEPGQWTKDSNYAPMLATPEGEAVYYAVRWLLYSRIPLDRRWTQDRRVLLVNYERMVNAPQIYLQQLCNFLEIEYSPTLIRHIHTKSIQKHRIVELPAVLLAACETAYQELCELEQAQWTT